MSPALVENKRKDVTDKVAADDELARAARPVMTLPLADGERDETLLARGLRLRTLARRVADLPDLTGQRCDRRALEAAALFHDASWAEDVRSGRATRDGVLLTPLDTRQRELSADLLIRATGPTMSAESCRVAARAIREAGVRSTKMVEAIALSEAVELDSIGPNWLLGEARRCWVRGRDAAELVSQWQSQVRYGYWEARLRERLRFSWSRRLAQARVAGLSSFFESLAGVIGGTD